jgi:hypothetical protein
MISFLRKVGLEIINLLFNNKVFFKALKSLNLVDAIFCVYPASERIARHFAFKSRLNKNTWTPFVIGFALQQSKITLTFAIAATEILIRNTTESDNLRHFNQKMSDIKNNVGAESVHYAGILPSYMKQRGVDRTEVEQLATVEAVVQAVKISCSDKKILSIVVLGHRGYIGSNVLSSLISEGFSVSGVEKGEIFYPPKGKYLVVNITSPDAIISHMDKFTSENTCVLNEVYPAPTGDILKKLKNTTFSCEHIVGVEAKCYPAFPGDYKGGIPCCGYVPGSSGKIIIKTL